MYMYEVCAKCGHVGRDNYIDKVFAIRAKDGKEAAAIVRQKPRVKHHHKDAIRYVKKIDADRYREILAMLAEDPYMYCHSIQEQRARCEMEVFREEQNMRLRKSEKEDKAVKSKYYRKMKLRHPKKYINNYISIEEYVS